ncbi:hypothetical protein [Facilibium subflavum]|uniref:hypothetical protein n=1 Tax=Facilibium subflavum TaxID=2219058 RepID=UPI000E6582E6|nr:hypothetical protein [Facilibium subflavum]
MRFDDFLVQVRALCCEISGNGQELNYITFTGTSIASDFHDPHALFHLHGDISSSQAANISQGWNYADAVLSVFIAADMLWQIYNDEIDIKAQDENAIKAGLLLSSAAIVIVLTAIGFSGWGFAIATIFDFGLAAWDFYDSWRMLHNFDFWLEKQLYQLDFFEKKLTQLKEVQNTQSQANSAQKQQEIQTTVKKLENAKQALLQNIKSRAAVHYYNNSNDEGFSVKLDRLCANVANRREKKRQKLFIHKEDRQALNDYVEVYKKQPLPSDIRRDIAIKKQLKDNLTNKGVMLGLKTASMVGMILLAIAVSAHPIGLAITIGVAVGYLLWKFGTPVIKRMFFGHKSAFARQRNPLAQELEDLKAVLLLPEEKNGQIVSSENLALTKNKLALYRIIHEISPDLLDQYYAHIKELADDSVKEFIEFLEERFPGNALNSENRSLIDALLLKWVETKDIEVCGKWLMDYYQLIGEEECPALKLDGCGFYLQKAALEYLKDGMKNLKENHFLSLQEKVQQYRDLRYKLESMDNKLNKIYCYRDKSLSSKICLTEFKAFIDKEERETPCNEFALLFGQSRIAPGYEI